MDKKTHALESEFLVLGAGAAGIAAARVLADAKRDVTVLEAGEIGGRIRTVNGIEHGAEFIHGMTDDFRARLNRYKLHADEYHPENAYAYIDGNLRPMDELPTSCDEIIRELRRLAKECVAQEDSGTTMANFFRNALQQKPEWQPMERLVRRAIQSEFGAPLHELSIHGFNEPTSYDDTNYRIREGYSTLLARMSEGITIHTSTPVSKVAWTPGRVDIENNGDKYSAQKLISTIPLAGLKNRDPEYSPDLPFEKRQAIEKLGAGRVYKIILTCREQLWNDDLEMIFSTLPTQTWWPGPRTADQPPTMIALIGGRDVENFAHSTKRAARSAVRDFERMFGPGSNHFIEDVDVVPWSEVDHIKMGYSFVPPRAPKARNALAEPIDDTLFFAGEATSTSWPGTVHGALESGERAAYEAMKMPMSPPASSADTSPAQA